jgi:hypothetical protein
MVEETGIKLKLFSPGAEYRAKWYNARVSSPPPPPPRACLGEECGNGVGVGVGGGGGACPIP